MTADLGSRAARAVVWNYISFASGKALVLVTMAVLARLLTPAEFGIVGFATLAVASLGVLKELGLGAALIQRQDDIEESAQTVYVLNLVSGAILTAITFAIAPAVATFFREPLVVPILRVLAFTFVLEAFGAVHLVLLRRELDFRTKLIPDTARAVIKGAVSITAAVAGFGVWALVWGQMASVVTSVIVARFVVGWSPTYRIHRRLVRPLLRFGMPLIVVDIQYAIWANLDYVFIGRFLGERSLGIYTIAYRLPELLVFAIWSVVAGAVFPYFSKIQSDPDELRRGFLATIRFSQAVVVPLCVGLIVSAELIVLTLFGDEWVEAIPVLRVLGVFALVASVGVNIGDVYKAVGRPDILAKLGVMDLFVLSTALFYGAQHGIVGVAWAHASVALFDTWIRLFVAKRFVDVTFADIGRQMLPSLLAGLALAGAASGALFLTHGMRNMVSLGLTMVAGAVTYATAMWHLDRRTVTKLLRYVGLGRLVEAS